MVERIEHPSRAGIWMLVAESQPVPDAEQPPLRFALEIEEQGGGRSGFYFRRFARDGLPCWGMDPDRAQLFRSADEANAFVMERLPRSPCRLVPVTA